MGWATLALAGEELQVETLANAVGNGGITTHPVTGDLYIGDFGNVGLANGTVVTRITPDGQVSTFATGTGNANGGGDFDSKGNLILAAYGSNRIWKIAPDGTPELLLAGIPGPVGLVIDGEDNVFIASCNSNTIRKISADGVPSIFSSGAGMNCPNGLTFDDEGNLYTVNHADDNMIKITPDGTASHFADLPGNGNGHVVFTMNQFYVTARTTNQVAVVTRDGQVSVLAGSGVAGDLDGPASQAQFSRPNGIGMSPDGRILYTNGNISTQGGINAIRKIVLEEPPLAFVVAALISGSWFDPTHEGEGFLIEVISDTLVVVYWFTYDEAGNQRWFFGVGTIDGNMVTVDELFVTTGGIFGPGFDPATVVAQVAGTLKFTFNECLSGIAEYTINGVDGMQTIERITSLLGLGCAPAKTGGSVGISGSWYDLTHDGEGFLVEILDENIALVYWFSYDDKGEQAWFVGVGSIEDKAIVIEEMLMPVGGSFGPDFDPATVELLPWGAVRLELGCSGGPMNYESILEQFGKGGQNLERITGIHGIDCD